MILTFRLWEEDVNHRSWHCLMSTFSRMSWPVKDVSRRRRMKGISHQDLIHASCDALTGRWRRTMKKDDEERRQEERSSSRNWSLPLKHQREGRFHFPVCTSQVDHHHHFVNPWCVCSPWLSDSSSLLSWMCVYQRCGYHSIKTNSNSTGWCYIYSLFWPHYKSHQMLSPPPLQIPFHSA